MSDHSLWTFRIGHILDAIEQIQSFTEGMSLEAFIDDEKTLRAVERCFEIIGEASRKIPKQVHDGYPDIPWKRIMGLRHFIAHQYDEVREIALWNTIRNDLDDLKKKLLAMELPESQ